MSRTEDACVRRSTYVNLTTNYSDSSINFKTAHRHPFLELMGVFYLMKLRYGEHFGQRAGSTWRLIFVAACFPWLNKYRILEKDAPDKVDDLELEAEGSPSDDAFEAVLPFERRLSAQEVEQQSELPAPRSTLMSKFQSLRSSFKDLEDVPPASLTKQPSSRRRSSRASRRSSLLLQELGGAQQGELQRRNVELEMKVIDLESENNELQAEIEQLSQDLGHRKTIDKQY